MFIWKFYNVIPYTQIKFVKNNMEDIKQYATEAKNLECVEFINKALKLL